MFAAFPFNKANYGWPIQSLSRMSEIIQLPVYRRSIYRHLNFILSNFFSLRSHLFIHANWNLPAFWGGRLSEDSSAKASSWDRPVTSIQKLRENVKCLHFLARNPMLHSLVTIHENDVLSAYRRACWGGMSGEDAVVVQCWWCLIRRGMDEGIL